MYLQQISLLEISPPTHPSRAVFDEAEDAELAEDIKKVGIIHPIHVKRVAGGYEVSDGHRRYNAAIAAGLAMVPCLVREEDDTSDLQIKVHANLFQRPLSPVEEGGFYAELYEAHGQDVDRVCELVGQNRAYVEGRLQLLAGDRRVLEAVAGKQISLGVARELNSCRREVDRHYLLGWAIEQGSTVSVVRSWVKDYNSRPEQPRREGAPDTVIGQPAAFESQPPRCYLCGGEDSPEEFDFHYIHRSCKKVVERQKEAMADK